VTLHERVYVSGRSIIADHAEKGISGLTARSIDGNVTGTSEERGPFSLVSVDSASETYKGVQDLFKHKYDQPPNVVLELVELTAESAESRS